MIKSSLVALFFVAPLALAQIPNMPSTATEATQSAKAMGTPADMAHKAEGKLMVHINSATPEELAKLPGIGPEKAKAIIAARPFQSVEDLKKVKGIKEAVFAKIKGMVSL